jgi:23S rRNA (pseudouridine1915-N3)-methyltransferase
LTVTEIADGFGAPMEIRRREGEALLAALPREAFAVVLDLDGLALSSEDLSARLEAWLGIGRPVAFVIGGAEGLSAEVVKRADMTVSLGRMTWPHMLARIMLAEQIFRARSIAAAHPYHRGGRLG